MTFQTNQEQFRVTPNQKLIAAKALEAFTQQEINPDDPRVQNFARALVVIHLSGMGPYFSRGFGTSMNRRSVWAPEQVAREREHAARLVMALQEAINKDTSVTAHRLRAKKARVDQAREEQWQETLQQLSQIDRLSLVDQSWLRARRAEQAA